MFKLKKNLVFHRTNFFYINIKNKNKNNIYFNNNYLKFYSSRKRIKNFFFNPRILNNFNKKLKLNSKKILRIYKKKKIYLTKKKKKLYKNSLMSDRRIKTEKQFRENRKFSNKEVPSYTLKEDYKSLINDNLKFNLKIN